MSHSQFQSTTFTLTHAWLNLWDERMTTGRINQIPIFQSFPDFERNKSDSSCLFITSTPFSGRTTIPFHFATTTHTNHTLTSPKSTLAPQVLQSLLSIHTTPRKLFPSFEAHLTPQSRKHNCPRTLCTEHALLPHAHPAHPVHRYSPIHFSPSWNQPRQTKTALESRCRLKTTTFLPISQNWT